MPKFTKMEPCDVVVGRGPTKLDRAPYRKALQGGLAGSITLEGDDRPGTVKRILREVAKELDIKVRSSWADETQRVLLWKKSPEKKRAVSAKPAAKATKTTSRKPGKAPIPIGSHRQAS